MTSVQSIRREPLLRFIPAGTFPIKRFPHFQVGISAGFPSPADDHAQKALDLNEHLVKHPAATIFAYLKGDSMRDAGMFDGDMMLIDRALEPKHGSIVVAMLNSEHTVKRLYKMNGIVKLVPANPKYNEIIITEDMDFEIVGVVTDVIRSVR